MLNLSHTPPAYRQLVIDQTTVGWGHLIRGRIISNRTTATVATTRSSSSPTHGTEFFSFQCSSTVTLGGLFAMAIQLDYSYRCYPTVKLAPENSPSNARQLSHSVDFSQWQTTWHQHKGPTHQPPCATRTGPPHHLQVRSRSTSFQ
jgi:hypothetical protein